MFSKRSSRFHRRNLSWRIALAGAAGLVAGPALIPALPAGASGRVPAGDPGPPYSLTWVTAHPAASPPPLRNAAAAFDTDTSTVVLFGGVTSSGAVSNDTWVWDGQTWTEHPAAAMTQAPPARQDASMAFDPALHQLILFGGAGSDGSILGDTWAWNGASWFQLPPGPSGSPGARTGAAMALGPNGNLVLFGGLGAVAGGLETTTSTTAPPNPGPPGGPTQAGNAAAGSPALALNGPLVLDDTWQWTSKGWAPSTSTGPAPRWGAALAYDSISRTTVLFGGDTVDPASPARPASDTWLWDGTNWTQPNPKQSPPARYEGVAADDPAAGGVLLTEGSTGSGVLADAWIWDGSSWAAAGSGSSPGRSGPAGAYDSARSATVLFGGAGAGGSDLGDTELVTTSHSAPPPPTTSGPATSPTTSPQLSTVPAAPSGSAAGHTTSPTTGGRPAGPATATRPSRPATAPGSTVAQPGPSSLSLETNLHDVRRGGTVQLAGSGFAPWAPITITFHSTPSLVGRSVAGPSGVFYATVSVPRTAAPGEHHFVATGMTSDGRESTLLATVFVIAPAAHKVTSLTVKLAMVGLALLIPAAAWLAMTGSGWWRRRPRTRPAEG